MNMRPFHLAALFSFLSSATFAATPTLSELEVIRLANAAAEKKGLKLTLFKRPKARYPSTARKENWYLRYEASPTGSLAGVAGGHFFVYVHDKTREAEVVLGR